MLWGLCLNWGTDLLCRSQGVNRLQIWREKSTEDWNVLSKFSESDIKASLTPDLMTFLLCFLCQESFSTLPQRQKCTCAARCQLQDASSFLDKDIFLFYLMWIRADTSQECWAHSTQAAEVISAQREHIQDSQTTGSEPPLWVPGNPQQRLKQKKGNKKTPTNLKVHFYPNKVFMSRI